MAVQQVVSYSATTEGRTHFLDTDAIRFLCRMIGDGDLVGLDFAIERFLFETIQSYLHHQNYS